MAEQKHSWNEQELWTVCVCYKERLPIELALRLTNTRSEKSMRMMYQNCLFLDKGRVENALSHPSRKLAEAWDSVEELYSTKIPIYRQQQEQDVCTDRMLIASMFVSMAVALFGFLKL
jgi:hypothetical protein